MDFWLRCKKCSAFWYSNAAREMLERREVCGNGSDGNSRSWFRRTMLSSAIPGQTMTPAEHTRRILLAGREEGVTFDRAWEQAMAAISPGAPERRDWLVALEATRGAWSDAYSREPLPVGAQAGPS